MQVSEDWSKMFMFASSNSRLLDLHGDEPGSSVIASDGRIV